jgi:hypothetical protein
MFGTSRKWRDSAEAATSLDILDFFAGKFHIWGLGSSGKMAFDCIPV